MATIARYDPFAVTRPLGGIVDRLLRENFVLPQTRNGSASAGRPSLYETADGFELHVALPGAKADELDVSIQDDVISIRGKTEWSIPEKATALWRGAHPGEFRHDWRLPGNVEGDEVKAQLEQGILRLTLPKAHAERPRRITVEGVAN